MARRSRRAARRILRQLGSIESLRALPPEEVQALADEVRPFQLPPGARLIEEGGDPDALFFIVQGRLGVERAGEGEVGEIGPGGTVGEIAILRGSPRTASVIARSQVSAFRISRESFEKVVTSSPSLREAMELLATQRGAVPLPSAGAWVATAMRASEARSRRMPIWLSVMLVGLFGWVLSLLNTQFGWVSVEGREVVYAVFDLMIGLLVLQGACESFIVGVERLGARLHWDGFLSGTLGSIVSTLPEFVVIWFLVRVNPLAAFITAIVTIFNNALVFAIYSFFLPKDRRGVYAMPRSLTIAGGEILIAGASISLIVGLLMLLYRVEGMRSSMEGLDLIVIGLVLLGIFAYYMVTLVQRFAEGKDDAESVPPDPARLGHDTRWLAILGMLLLGVAGAYCGGESIGAFAETALTRLGLPTIPTAAALAFFAGISEYVIVFKSHRRGELGIALSNVFGGMSQVMFMLLPFCMILIGVMGLLGAGAGYAVPILTSTTMLVLLLFPLFYALHQYLELDKSLSNLDALALTGIYTLLLYFLFSAPS